MKMNKEKWICTTLIIIAVGLGIGRLFHLPIPNPLEGLKWVFAPFSEMIYGEIT